MIVFGHVIRQLKRDTLKGVEFTIGQVQAPSPKAHVDFSETNIEASLGRVIPGAVDWMNSGKAKRWQVLGIWRPIKTVSRDPLVLTDSRSVPAGDYRDLSREKSLGQKLYVTMITHGEGSNHRWHYLSDMNPEEVLIFKHYDSKKDIPAWRCGHTSVNISGTEDLPARESIEVRAFVGY